MAAATVATVTVPPRHPEESDPSRIEAACVCLIGHFECSPYIDEPSRYIEIVTLSTPQA
jgi:hypothetical protein